MTQVLTPSTPAAVPAARVDRRPGRQRRRADRLLALFAAPALLCYAFFLLGPLVAVFYISFLRWPGMLAPSSWIGLDNYRRMIDDPVFWTACRVTAIQLVATVPALVVLSFMLGYYVAQNPPGVRALRVLLFIPGLLSLAAQTTVFFAVLSPNGLINSTLQSLGLDSWVRAWLADPATALPALILVTLWGGVGYTSILFSANLSSIEEAVYEAAELDGAGRWRTMWRIAFPMSYSYVGVVTMLQLLWNLFGSAAIVLLLTKGGPGNSTTTLSYLVYQKAFLQYNVGYSQAIGVVLFVVGMLGILIIRRIFRPRF
ncbi:carbohydrate ABC transporter permease [Plantactinospora siamensis]|uniref:Carbohydrate ABC transporter permease n=1 Tax=Plantactinospora siamensis TaxID=555372 RepID=A0ABV6P3E3_9ACTN